MGYRYDVGSENMHSYDIGVLFDHIHFTHIDIALQADQCCCCSERHTMLACACFSDEFLFAHFFGEQCFAEAVIDLVCAGMVEVFTLHIDLCAIFFGEVLGMKDRSRASDIVLIEIGQLSQKLRIGTYSIIRSSDFVHNRLQFRRNETSPILTEVALLIRERAVENIFCHRNSFCSFIYKKILYSKKL